MKLFKATFFLMILPYIAIAAEWQKVSIQPASQTLNDIIVIDQERVVSVGDYGLIKISNDFGESWQTVRGSYDLEHLNALASNGSTVLAVGDNGEVLRSNYGYTQWFSIDSHSEFNLNDIYINSDNGLITGDNGVVLVSNNGGEDWTLKAIQTQENLNCAYIDNNNRFFVFGDNGTCLLSDNNGDTWQDINIGTENNILCYTVADNNYLYLAGDKFTLIKTDSNFENITHITPDGLPDYFHSILYINENLMFSGGFYGGSNAQGWSNDGGKSWYKSIFSDVPFKSFSKFSNYIFICGYIGGILKYDLNEELEMYYRYIGKVVEVGTKPLNLSGITGYKTDILVSNNDNSLFISLDSGITWKHIYESKKNKIKDIFIPERNKIIIVLDSSKFISENGTSFFKHWPIINVIDENGSTLAYSFPGNEFDTKCAEFIDSYGILFSWVNYMVTNDYGMSWKTYEYPDDLYFIHGNLLSPGVIYAIFLKNNNFVFLKTFNEFEDYIIEDNVLKDCTAYSKINFINESIGWYLASNHLNNIKNSIYKTENGGKVWDLQLSEQLPFHIYLKEIAFSDPNNGFCAGVQGYIYHTSDGGEHWDETFVDTEGFVNNSIYFPNSDIAFYGDGLGIWRYINHSMNIEKPVLKNDGFTISPNPAHDYIEIPETYGTIAIYSTLGIKVMEINNPGARIDISRLHAGVYYISINGRFEKFVKI